MGLYLCLWIAYRNQLKAVQFPLVGLEIEIVWNSNLGFCYLHSRFLATLWTQEHYPVSLAEVYYVYALNSGSHRMHNLVVPHVDSSMGIPLLVGDEPAIQILVIPPYQNVTRLDYLHYLKYVMPVDNIRVWVIRQHREAVEGENLYLPEIGQKLRPDAI